MKKHYSIVTLAAACAAGFVLALLLVAGLLIFRLGGIGGLPYAAKFAEVYNTIDRNFVGSPDMASVSDAAYSAMVTAIDDKWSYYMNADQYREYQKYMENSYTGIGVTIEQDAASGLYKVAAVQEGSPAQTAGVKIGELLSAVNGESLQGKTSEDIKKQISAISGEFKLTLRGEDGTERDVTVSWSLPMQRERCFSIKTSKKPTRFSESAKSGT